MLNLNVKNKADALEKISVFLYKKHFIKDSKKFLKDLQNRENQFSTGIGKGIAIPHAQSKSVKKNVVLIAKLKKAVDWKAMDNKNVDIIFTIALNKKQASKQIKILQNLSKIMMNEKLMEKVRITNNKNLILKTLQMEGE